MNESKEQARVRDTKINVALYNAATDYAAYVMSDRHDYDEAMKLAGALEAAAVRYAEIAGDREPEAEPSAENIAGSFQRMVGMRREYDIICLAPEGFSSRKAANIRQAMCQVEMLLETGATKIGIYAQSHEAQPNS